MAVKLDYECQQCGTVKGLLFTGYRKPAPCTVCGSVLQPEMTTWERCEPNRNDPERVSNE